jgi:hypothetical protein
MAVTKITADFIDADAVEETQIKDAAVATAKVADNAITLAKMAGGTDGNLISYDSAGDPVAVVTGDAGQVLQSAGAGQPPAMAWTGLVQAVHTADEAVDTGTTVMAMDDSIPQITEGDEYMTVTITPKSTSHRLIIEAVINGSSSTIAFVCGLFQDSTAGALAASLYDDSTANRTSQVVIRYEMAAGTTSSTTFRIRVGPASSGTFTLNGTSAARLLGGVFNSSLRVTEIA